MKAIGIVTEYNPFHNGHLYQTELIREKIGSNGAIVSVMSGSFTQRGEISVLDKWARAKTAIQSGVDLVLELPTVFAVSSADGFASGAVQTLAAAAVIGEMAFGSESGHISDLQAVATFLTSLESDSDAQESIRDFMKQGIGYAAALTRLVDRALGEDQGLLMQEPNNILGISYLKAIANLPAGRNIKAMTHGREGGAHLDSASQLRRIVGQYQHEPAALMKAISGKVPPATAAALGSASRNGSLLLPADLSASVFQLIRRSKAETLQEYAGMNDGLAERLTQAASRLPHTDDASLSVYERLIDASRARHLTQARVQRALAALLLGITDEDMQTSLLAGPQYIRVLAFNKKGQYILKQMRKYATLPIITKGSDFREHNDKGELFRRQYELDLIASDLRAVLCKNEKTAQDFDTAVLIR